MLSTIDRREEIPLTYCPNCGKPTLLRLPSRVNTPGSSSTFRPYWSEQLAQGDGKVYVKDREEWKRLMKERGVRPWEPGHRADLLRERRECEMKRVAKARQDVAASLDDAMREVSRG